MWGWHRDGNRRPPHALRSTAARRGEHRFLDLWVAPVQVGLLLVELVIVELVQRRDPFPGRAAEERYPVVRRDDLAFGPVLHEAALVVGDSWRVCGHSVVPAVPVVFRAGARACGLCKPRMLIRGMVQHHVQDDSDVMLAGRCHHAIEVSQSAVLRVHGFVVGDVIAEVNLWRGIHRRDPDGINPEMLEIAQPCGDPIQIADTVPVRVLKGSRINFVEDRVLPPVGTGCGRSSRRRSLPPRNGLGVRD